MGIRNEYIFFLAILRITNIVLLIIFVFQSCSFNHYETKYFTINSSIETSFPAKIKQNTTAIIRADLSDENIIIDIIKNDSICSTKLYKLRNDTILGPWKSIEEYSYRLLFPKFHIEHSKISSDKFESTITEIMSSNNWHITKEWGIVLKSQLSGKVTFNEHSTILDTKSSIGTSAKPFINTSKITIQELNDLNILKFDLKWNKYCMRHIE